MSKFYFTMNPNPDDAFLVRPIRSPGNSSGVYVVGGHLYPADQRDWQPPPEVVEYVEAIIAGNPEWVLLDHPNWDFLDRRSDEAYKYYEQYTIGRLREALGEILIVQFGVGYDVPSVDPSTTMYNPELAKTWIGSGKDVFPNVWVCAPGQWSNATKERGYAWTAGEYKRAVETLVYTGQNVITWIDKSNWSVQNYRDAMTAACYHLGVPVEPIPQDEPDYMDRLLAILAQEPFNYSDMVALLAEWSEAENEA